MSASALVVPGSHGTRSVYAPCPSRKRAFLSRREARRFLKNHRATTPNYRSVAVYECDRCGFWHTTSRERS